MEAHRLADRQRNRPVLIVQTSRNSDHTRTEITQTSPLRHIPNNHKHYDRNSSSWGPKSIHDRKMKYDRNSRDNIHQIQFRSSNRIPNKNQGNEKWSNWRDHSSTVKQNDPKLH